MSASIYIKGDVIKIRHLAILASIIPLMIACGGTTNNSGTPATSIPNGRNYTLTAWNDLGMHCMDSNYFSVFSVLPPYNNLHAQIKDKNGDLITSGITLTYESTMGTDGKINTKSASKTNFWDYVKSLFGADVQPNVGLTGNPMSSATPAAMTYNSNQRW